MEEVGFGSTEMEIPVGKRRAKVIKTIKGKYKAECIWIINIFFLHSLQNIIHHSNETQ